MPTLSIFNIFLTVIFNNLKKIINHNFFNFVVKAKMLLKRTNIEEKLQRLKAKTLNSTFLINEFYKVLEEASKNQGRIIKNTQVVTKNYTNNFNFDDLETDKIYHVSQIKKICIDYRLRFLDAKYFKNEIPSEAISKIKQLEEVHQTEIQNFKIVAPSKLFKLEDKDDPLLFAPLGNDYYYLIHKWGNDLSRFRKMKMWPFKSVINLLVLILFMTYVITLLIPSGLFSKTDSSAEFFILAFFMFKTIAAIALYFGIAKSKNFSPFIWNSKYFN
jgi:hypothetical protein